MKARRLESLAHCEKLVASLVEMLLRCEEQDASLIAALEAKHISTQGGVSGGGGGPPPVVMSASVRAEIAQEVEEKIAKILESAHSTGSTHQINTPYDQQALLSTSPTNIP